MPELRLLALYPEQMNIYADRGNVIFLRERCRWRGIGFSYAAAGPGEGFDPEAHDLIYIGGGQDRDQLMVAEDMRRTKRDAIAAAPPTAPRCSRSAVATSSSAAATSSASGGSRGSGSRTSRPSGRKASG